MRIFTLRDSYKDNSYGVEDDDGRILRYFDTRDGAQGYIHEYYSEVHGESFEINAFSNINGDYDYQVSDRQGYPLHVASSYHNAEAYIEGRGMLVTDQRYLNVRTIPPELCYPLKSILEPPVPDVDLKDALQ